MITRFEWEEYKTDACREGSRFAERLPVSLLEGRPGAQFLEQKVEKFGKVPLSHLSA